ncbi:hypothetical protein C8R43DRAFT_210992 [Mycena crocata]|nr:hypothetical protein C8R43DRAFT_210992 [Mycena crocata]
MAFLDSSSVCDNCGRTPFRKSPLFFLANDPMQIDEVHGILRSNTFSLDTARFQSVVDESALELERYDAEIDRLTQVRDRLVAERTTIAAYVDRCRNVFSPVRRLPPELWAEIFDMCAPLSARGFTETDTYVQEMDRLSQRHLLESSQVCFHWHSICMATPRLWSTVVVNTMWWGQCMASESALLGRLRSSLERSGSYPLTLFVMDLGDTGEHPVLQLLVQHSARWRDVFININPDSYCFLASARNKLPLLEVLDIVEPGDGSVDLDIFRCAPRLTEVTFDGPSSCVPQLPWDQLWYFGYRSAVWQPDLFPQLSLLCKLSPRTKFCCAVETNMIGLARDIPSILSNIPAISLPYTGNEFPEHAKELLGVIFTALTLPRLLALELHRPVLEPAPPWHHTHFITFAARSSLHAHLVELEIHAIITDDELVQCLTVLPLVKTLTISDRGGPSDHVVFTDHLLQRLTYTAEVQKCLIPNLHYFNVTTRFQFTPDVYLDFLASRLVPGRTHDKAPSSLKGEIWEFIYPPSCEPFQARVWWLPNASGAQQLPPNDFTELLEAQIAELVKRGELGFRSGLHPDAPTALHVAVGDVLVA